MPTAVQAAAVSGYDFLKAVRDGKGDEVQNMVTENGTRIINTRDDSTRETALHILAKRRDQLWLNYFLSNEANPNIGDKQGDTPLMIAAQLGFSEGVELLLKFKAQVDATNRKGETALIHAVHFNRPDVVRLLLAAGANPDKADSFAGRSARDYAKEGRTSQIASIIENAGKQTTAKPGNSGELDFSGIGDDAK